MHEHHEEKCKHELKYCARCDVVYCERCGREWVDKRKQITTWRAEPAKPWDIFNSPKWNSASFHEHIDMETE